MLRRTEMSESLYRLEVDDLAAMAEDDSGYKAQRLFEHWQSDPVARAGTRSLAEGVVAEALDRWSKEYRDFSNLDYQVGRVLHSLSRDGFSYDEEKCAIVPQLPHTDLAATDDEIHLLLSRFRFETTRGHLEQALENHSKGNWAAANSQLRTFLESLLEEIAKGLVPSAGQNSSARYDALAKHGFLSLHLYEWTLDGKNLVNGVFKHLHTTGSHPGLSDEEDSTFRLHLVLILGRRFLRRYQAKQP